METRFGGKTAQELSDIARGFKPVPPLTAEQLKAFLTAPVIGYVVTPKLFKRVSK